MNYRPGLVSPVGVVMNQLILFFLLSLSTPSVAQNFEPFFLYSQYGDEMEVSFEAHYLTAFKTIEDMNKELPEDRSYYANYTVEPTIKYLFGPLTHRSWGGIQKTLKLELDWDRAEVTDRGVILPYSYTGLWLVGVRFLDQPNTPIPLPYNTTVILSERWKYCTDSHHQEQSSFWYYWEPQRSGCDHVAGLHYQNISVKLANPTAETAQSFPEYQRMIRMRDGKPTLSMTFAFGYVEEQSTPNPDLDSDAGAREFQTFVREIRKLMPSTAKEKRIMRQSYPYFEGRDFIMGHRFLFTREGIHFDVKVVMNSGVDQMYLFARSYAEEHDGYFGWMGHSRIGSGFDANRFSYLLKNQPETYSLTKDYQVIYWGGCNSYSYYTVPFFAQKAQINDNDPNGTRSLDIIANGLPSYFSFNAANALIHFKTFTNLQQPTSYQSLLSQMEQISDVMNMQVLAVVIGDEDNNLQ